MPRSCKVCNVLFTFGNNDGGINSLFLLNMSRYVAAHLSRVSSSRCGYICAKHDLRGSPIVDLQVLMSATGNSIMHIADCMVATMVRQVSAIVPSKSKTISSIFICFPFCATNLRKNNRIFSKFALGIMALQGSILVVDDNRNIRVSLKYLLEGCFTKVLLVDTPELLPSMLRQEQIDVVLLDMNFSPGLNTGNEGLYWLREIKRLRPQAQVVLFTAYADIALAVTGIKEGAFDFVVKPWDNAKLKQTLTDAYRLAKGKRHNGKRMEQEPVDAMYWGNTPAMERIKVMTVEQGKICLHGKFTVCRNVVINSLLPLIWVLLPSRCLKVNYSGT